jgi:hypothetical protein
VVDPTKHHVIDRLHWHAMLADILAEGTFALLHAHRQGGKSSAARAVGTLLERRGEFCVLTCTMESVHPHDAGATWKALEAQLRGVIYEFPPGWAPARVVVLLDAGLPLFKDAASFQVFFYSSLWEGLRFVLIIDEFDTLLEAPTAARHELLSFAAVAADTQQHCRAW